jgi:hypothetical protein
VPNEQTTQTHALYKQAHELFCSLVGKLTAECLGDYRIHVKRYQHFSPFVRRGQASEIRFSTQHYRGVRVEGQHKRRITGLMCLADEGAQDLLVTAMDTVEYANGQPDIAKGDIVKGKELIHGFNMD